MNHLTIHKNRGFSMLEVLVALVILMTGLLGLAGLQMRAHQGEMESYQRVQALVLLQDMANRINANRKVADCYAITASSGTPYFGNGYTGTPTCTAGTLEQQTLAVQDMTDWDALLKGSAEAAGANKVGAMIGARGCVSYDATSKIYLITVAWQGKEATTAPPSGLTCATGAYGNESLRRATSLTLQVATLG